MRRCFIPAAPPVGGLEAGAASAVADGGTSTVKRAPTGVIVFDANVPVVLGHDVAHDREAQAGTAILGGKVGQEQLLFVVRRLTPGPESATTSSTVSAAPCCVAIYSSFTSESCMASAALSIRLTTTRWNCSRSRLTGGRASSKPVRIEIPSSRPWKTAMASRTTWFRSERTGCAAGKRANCENSSTNVFTDSTDFAMVAAHSLTTRAPWPGGSSTPVELARDALGGKRDGRQRVLDLVRDAPRHLMPGRGFLRAQQLAGIFQNHHEAGGQLLFQRGNRDRQVQIALFRAQLQLPRGGAGTARALHQVLDLGRIFAREQIFQPGGAGGLFGRKDLRKRPIDALDRSIGGDRDHAGRNALQDRFGKAAPAVQLARW